ncbi:cathepsin B [Leptinotarsa decemlineata]|uniref:cathepsin B n=1 Tax=Leptinotarsa decemlineata TaxID=7539 RepID=UPI003D304303
MNRKCFQFLKMRVSLLFFFIGLVVAGNTLDELSDEYIENINKQSLTWKARRFFDDSMTLSDIKNLLGVLRPENKLGSLPVRYHDEKDDTEIPESFDARKKWSNCESIHMIRDQANCGSCWAFAAVEAMSDRICIHSNGEKQILVSAEDLLSCCGIEKCGNGCDGGYPAAAWEYWYTDGLASGGLYQNSTQGCKAYSLKPCDHHIKGGINCTGHASTPACTKQCDNSTLDYKSQKTFGKNAYVTFSTVSIVNKHLFFSGVYRMQEDNLTSIGEHAVKIIGWGVEEKVPYWLVVNSWNEHWGDKGLFKIVRGENHCGIEDHIVAGLPVGSSGVAILAKIKILALIMSVLSYFSWSV